MMRGLVAVAAVGLAVRGAVAADVVAGADLLRLRAAAHKPSDHVGVQLDLECH